MNNFLSYPIYQQSNNKISRVTYFQKYESLICQVSHHLHSSRIKIFLWKIPLNSFWRPIKGNVKNSCPLAPRACLIALWTALGKGARPCLPFTIPFAPSQGPGEPSGLYTENFIYGMLNWIHQVLTMITLELNNEKYLWYFWS